MLELTKKTVEKLQKETGHAIIVADFDDIDRLDELAAGLSKQTPDERRLLKSPFDLCGIKFYPLTIAKSAWYAEKCAEWEVSGIFQDVFLFWLLTLPLTADALDGYSTLKDTDKAVKRLARRLHCTPDEMSQVFKKCVGGNGKQESNTGEQKEEAATNYGGLIACLVREYGGTVDKWLYETPIETIGALMDQFIHKVNAEHDAGSTSAAKRGKAVAPKATAKLQALRDFRVKANELKQKWSAKP
jgi:hypothetical protein